VPLASSVMTTTSEQTYVFDQGRRQERRRLELFELVRDPATVRRLECTGVGAGWRCLEIGAGRGSDRALAGTTHRTGWLRARDRPRAEPPMISTNPRRSPWRRRARRRAADSLVRSDPRPRRARTHARPFASDWACGRELVHELGAAGLEVIEADADLDTIAGSTPVAEWYRESFVALRDAVRCVAGSAGDADIDDQLVRLTDPAFRALGLTWIGAIARAA
jgi:hypothetical protein